jgi:hypothetical protein
MPPKDPIRVGDLIGQGRLGALTQEARRRRDVADRVRSLLPPEEAAHVVGASTTADGELVLALDSAVWAARVRYRVRELGTRRVRIKVVPRGARVD